MMESFGIKLQRKALYDEFLESHNALESMMKKRGTLNNKNIEEKVSLTGKKMTDLLNISSVEPCSLKNQHN